MWLINSEPLSEWNPKIGNGNCSSIAFSTGIKYCSLDLAGATNHFPLQDRVHSVDVVHPFGSIPVALMHRVYTQVARTSLRVWPAALGNRHPALHACRRLEYRAVLPSEYPTLLRRIVEVRQLRGSPPGAHIPEFVVLLVFPSQNASRCRPTHPLRAPDPLTPAASHPRQCTSAETAAVGAAVARSSPSPDTSESAAPLAAKGSSPVTFVM